MKNFSNNKTKIFISVSKFPGNSGSNFHNSLFNYFKINSLYSFKVKLRKKFQKYYFRFKHFWMFGINAIQNINF